MAYNPAPIPESGQSPLDQLDPSKPGAQQNITSGLDANPSGRVEARDTVNTSPLGSGSAGTDALKGQAAAPPSKVADFDYPNVPETTEPQQGEFKSSRRD